MFNNPRAWLLLFCFFYFQNAYTQTYPFQKITLSEFLSPENPFNMPVEIRFKGTLESRETGSLLIQEEALCNPEEDEYAGGHTWYGGPFQGIIPITIENGTLYVTPYRWNSTEAEWFSYHTEGEGLSIRNDYYNALPPAIYGYSRICSGMKDFEVYNRIIRAYYLVNSDPRPTDLFFKRYNLSGEGLSIRPDGTYDIKPGSNLRLDFKVGGLSFEDWEKLVNPLTPKAYGVFKIGARSIPGRPSNSPLIDAIYPVSIGDVDGVLIPSDITEEFELSYVINEQRVITETSYENNTLHFKVNGTPSQEATLSVKSAKLAQVIYNPQKNYHSFEYSEYLPLNVDLTQKYFLAVQGKSASFEIELEGKNLQSKSGQLIVEIYQDSELLSQSKPFSIKSLDGKVIVGADSFKSFVPNKVGIRNLFVRIASTDDTLKTENLVGYKIETVKTYAPDVALTRITSPGRQYFETTNIQNYTKMLSLSKYISDLFPVPDNSIVLKDIGDTLVPQTNSIIDRKFNANLLMEAKRRLLGKDRIVGIVSESYMSYIGKEEDGLWNPNVPEVALVRERFLKSLPHELAHSFSAVYELYSKHENLRFKGYNANGGGYAGKTMAFENVKSIMNLTDAVPNSMPLKPMPDDTLSPEKWRWIDDRTYSVVYDYLSKQQQKTKAILILGVLSKDGKVNKQLVYDLPYPITTKQVVNGVIVVQGTDANGKVIKQNSFTPIFKISLSTVIGGQYDTEENSAPFSITLPADPAIQNIRLVKNGTVISNMSVSAGNLVTSVERLPVEAYRKFCKNNLDSMIKIREKIIDEAKHVQSAFEKKEYVKTRLLLSILRKSIKHMTSGSFVPKDESELSQSSVVGVINSFEKKLPPVKTCKSKGR